jgi:hypothetical protein
MSVFCRWTDTENLDDCSSVYSFENFESGLRDVINIIEPGGLLVVYNSNFRVHDSKCFERLEHIDITHESGFVKKFGPDNKALVDQGYEACIFRVL